MGWGEFATIVLAASPPSAHPPTRIHHHVYDSGVQHPRFVLQALWVDTRGSALNLTLPEV